MKKLFLIFTILICGCLPLSAFGQGLDVVFQVDESGSMGGEISSIQNNVNTIAASLPPGFRAAVVGFGFSSNSGTHSGVVPHAHCNLIDLNSDLAGFQSCVNELTASGGIEPGYDAIVQSADGTLGLGLTGPSFCSILFADEPNNGSVNSQQDAIDALTVAGGVFFGVTPQGSPTTSYQPIADATGGMMFDLGMFTANPDPVLQAILGACEIVLQGSDFLFYKMIAKSDHHLDLESSQITLRDQFNEKTEGLHFIVTGATELGNPANLKDEEIPGSENHFVAYQIIPNIVKNALKDKGKLFKKFPRVKVMNPDDSMNRLFEEMTLKLWNSPVRLLVPSAKSLDGPVDPLENPGDHFQCYGVIKASGFEKQKVSV
ncbi:MAG: hypothetical protein R3351_08260, partial [Nitrospirales bacterium]|nr:hypothetical protein [Nitrospirales bacterium]